MKANAIVETLHCETLGIWNQHLMEKEYHYVFAADLMSDALAMVTNHFDSTILVTGLCNAQALRTAEMLDLEMIIFVRGKKLDQDVLQLAMEMGFNVFSTKETMFKTCGLLYEGGMRAPNYD